MWASGGGDGADGTACRAAFARIRASVRTARNQVRAADGERDGCGAHPDSAGARERGDRCGVRNPCADTGAREDEGTRTRRDRRAASFRGVRSREAESIGAEGDSADDDGDADSTKPGDEPVLKSRRLISRRAAGGTNADR